MQQTRDKGKHILLCLGAAFGGKTVVCITGETAGEVLADMAIGNSLRAVHHNLCTVIQLRNTAHGKQQCQALLQRLGILSVTQEAVGVVIVEERHDTRRIGIKIIIAERIVETIVSAPPVIGNLMRCRVYLLLEREIHNGLQIAVDVAQLTVFLPGSSIGRLRDPCLTDGVEIGIFVIELFHPLSHRLAESVGIGIHADAINVGSLNPPDAVLDEITHEVRIVLVEVGHGIDEPRLGSLS